MDADEAEIERAFQEAIRHGKSNRSRFRCENAQKQAMQNIVVKRQARREGTDFDCRLAKWLRVDESICFALVS